MAKDPAFLFYSQDFIVGTMIMSFEDKGKYITILSMMHQQGRMNEETIRLLVGYVSDILKSKFLIDENNLWYNVKLESETQKRNQFTESRRNNGYLGGRPKKETKPKNNLMDNLQDNHMGNHMENENEDVNESIKNKVFSFNDALLILGADKDLVTDWLKVRKTKKATNSPTALILFKNEVEKSGKGINEVLKLCIGKDWKSFKAEWKEGNSLTATAGNIPKIDTSKNEYTQKGWGN